MSNQTPTYELYEAMTPGVCEWCGDAILTGHVAAYMRKKQYHPECARSKLMEGLEQIFDSVTRYPAAQYGL